jgi:tetratricopeptide (TPR) repeat protein
LPFRRILVLMATNAHWRGPRTPRTWAAVRSAGRTAMRCGTAVEPAHYLVATLTDVASLASALVAATGADPTAIAASLRVALQRNGPSIDPVEPSPTGEQVLLRAGDLAAASGAAVSTSVSLLYAALSVEAETGSALARELLDAVEHVASRHRPAPTWLHPPVPAETVVLRAVTEAADQGEPAALAVLGCRAAVDDPTGSARLEAAAEAGSNLAARELAARLDLSLDTVEPIESLLRPAIERGDAEAASELGFALRIVPGRASDAEHYARLGVAGGAPRGNLALYACLIDQPGRRSEAIAILQEAVRLGEEFAAGNLAHLYGGEERWSDALPFYELAVAQGDGTAAGGLVLALGRVGRVEDALAVANGHRNSYGVARMMTSVLLERAPRHPQTRPWAMRAVKMEGDRSAHLLGTLLARDPSRRDEARQLYAHTEAALRDGHALPGGRWWPEAARQSQLAYLILADQTLADHRNSDRIAEARILLERAHRTHPEQPTTRHRLALAYCFEGRFSEARNLLGDDKPSYAWLAALIAWATAGSGDKESARDLLSQAERLGGHPLVYKVRNELGLPK